MTMTTRVELTFELQGSSTLVTVVQSGFPVPAVRDFFQSEVWVGAFDRIEAFLAR
jgi:hypothetical protein